jgi:hypothetical protein
MNLADVFTILLVILGFLIVYVSYWLMSAALFPKFAEHCAAQIGRAPIKTALLGAVTFAPLVAIGMGIGSKIPNPAAKLLGFSVALAALLAALFGSAGLALRIGQGLKSARDETEPWRRVLRGGIVLVLTFVLPFLGWFAVMPLTFVVGFGAFLICMFQKKLPASAPVVATEPPPVPMTAAPAFPALP